MGQCVVISGQLNSEGKLELNEQIPLPPGPVRVSIEPVNEFRPLETTGGFVWPSTEELARRKAAMMECVGCLSDEEAEAILKTVEEEFEQVNLDEWR